MASVTEQLEETRTALADMVVFLRGTAQCPTHDHISVFIMTHDGPVPWHGPACELPDDPFVIDCDYIEGRNEVLEKAYEALGTKDMTNYL